MRAHTRRTLRPHIGWSCPQTHKLKFTHRRHTNTPPPATKGRGDGHDGLSGEGVTGRVNRTHRLGFLSVSFLFLSLVGGSVDSGSGSVLESFLRCAGPRRAGKKFLQGNTLPLPVAHTQRGRARARERDGGEIDWEARKDTHASCSQTLSCTHGWRPSTLSGIIFFFHQVGPFFLESVSSVSHGMTAATVSGP